ncbi:MAG TPA: branched-chain amino acid ABC transporter substrate-binding protein [Solirubrobacteraceae bacterium]|jgi:branched-chain amino acid transport system substrate-binding protein|nr:branched-chain amino acid ABC transporter substrate-binding protein [Solirubrobacteraceae bacterium]
MRARWLAVAGCGLVTIGLAACGSSGGGTKISGNTLTIYSSLPLQGASRVNSEATVNGEKLALAAIGAKIGSYTVNYTSLDDSTAQAGKWDPGQTSTNARKAASDKTTIGYLGEFNSGASAISIPILNRATIGQISPSNTAVGLTSGGPGTTPGEPQKYYPTGKRTYARVVPKDTVQAAAQASLQKLEGCKKVATLNDQEVYGAGLATNLQTALPKVGLTSAGNLPYDPKAANYRSLASRVAGTGADCVFISAITENNAVQLTKDMASALPTAKIFGPDGVAESTYTDPAKGGIPLALDSRVFITVATLAPSQYPPAGKAFFQTYGATYHPSKPEPYAIYGYETMGLMLDAIKRATAGGVTADRAKVIAAIYATRDRPSVLGTYSIDANGDTTLTDYGSYKVKAGQLVFFKTIKATAAA